jgi:hypothetical protein
MAISEGKGYLKGIRPGDEVEVFNILGQKLSAFKASSDAEIITGKGIRLIRISTAGDRQILKTIL